MADVEQLRRSVIDCVKQEEPDSLESAKETCLVLLTADAERSSVYWTTLGLLTLRLSHEFGKAIDYFTKALEVETQLYLRALLLNYRGCTYQFEGNSYAKAIDDFSAAINIVPRHGYYAARGFSRVEAQLFTAGLEDLNNALLLYPPHAELAEQQKAEDNFLLPGTAAHLTADFHPKLCSVYCARGKALYELHQVKHAVANFTKSIDILRPLVGDAKPPFPNKVAALEVNCFMAALRERGVCYVELRQERQALSDFYEASALATLPDHRNWLAEIIRDTKQEMQQRRGGAEPKKTPAVNANSRPRFVWRRRAPLIMPEFCFEDNYYLQLPGSIFTSLVTELTSEDPDFEHKLNRFLQSHEEGQYASLSVLPEAVKCVGVHLEFAASLAVSLWASTTGKPLADFGQTIAHVTEAVRATFCQSLAAQIEQEIPKLCSSAQDDAEGSWESTRCVSAFHFREFFGDSFMISWPERSHEAIHVMALLEVVCTHLLLQASMLVKSQCGKEIQADDIVRGVLYKPQLLDVFWRLYWPDLSDTELEAAIYDARQLYAPLMPEVEQALKQDCVFDPVLFEPSVLTDGAPSPDPTTSLDSSEGEVNLDRIHPLWQLADFDSTLPHLDETEACGVCPSCMAADDDDDAGGDDADASDGDADSTDANDAVPSALVADDHGVVVVPVSHEDRVKMYPGLQLDSKTWPHSIRRFFYQFGCIKLPAGMPRDVNYEIRTQEGRPDVAVRVESPRPPVPVVTVPWANDDDAEQHEDYTASSFAEEAERRAKAGEEANQRLFGPDPATRPPRIDSAATDPPPALALYPHLLPQASGAPAASSSSATTSSVEGAASSGSETLDSAAASSTPAAADGPAAATESAKVAAAAAVADAPKQPERKSRQQLKKEKAEQAKNARLANKESNRQNQKTKPKPAPPADPKQLEELEALKRVIMSKLPSVTAAGGPAAAQPTTPTPSAQATTGASAAALADRAGSNTPVRGPPQAKVAGKGAAPAAQGARAAEPAAAAASTSASTVQPASPVPPASQAKAAAPAGTPTHMGSPGSSASSSSQVEPPSEAAANASTLVPITPTQPSTLASAPSLALVSDVLLRPPVAATPTVSTRESPAAVSTPASTAPRQAAGTASTSPDTPTQVTPASTPSTAQRLCTPSQAAVGPTHATPTVSASSDVTSTNPTPTPTPAASVESSRPNDNTGTRWPAAADSATAASKGPQPALNEATRVDGSTSSHVHLFDGLQRLDGTDAAPTKLDAPSDADHTQRSAADAFSAESGLDGDAGAVRGGAAVDMLGTFASLGAVAGQIRHTQQQQADPPSLDDDPQFQAALQRVMQQQQSEARLMQTGAARMAAALLSQVQSAEPVTDAAQPHSPHDATAPHDDTSLLDVINTTKAVLDMLVPKVNDVQQALQDRTQLRQALEELQQAHAQQLAQCRLELERDRGARLHAMSADRDARLHAVSATNAALEAKLQAKGQRCTALEKEVKALESSLQASRSKLQSKADKADALNKELAAFKAKAEDARRSLQRELEASKASQAALQKQLEGSAKNQQRELEAARAQHRTELAAKLGQAKKEADAISARLDQALKLVSESEERAAAALSNTSGLMQRVNLVTGAGLQPLSKHELNTLRLEIKHTLDMIEDEQSSRNEGDCHLCLQNEKQVAVIPCGHCCMCVECSDRFKPKLCPICRGPVAQLLRIFTN
eukprot:TRINITY_DN1278_c0_g2_i1.p1 TRINITY_DN1278_c0_g2~~TRINITY_DN1278_c0_g2_i1.p1  ORF type:complete len:1702 (+),score=535.05 TRINITY_DN1278_c0_g2_i1:114-5219(+)